MDRRSATAYPAAGNRLRSAARRVPLCARIRPESFAPAPAKTGGRYSSPLVQIPSSLAGPLVLPARIVPERDATQSVRADPRIVGGRNRRAFLHHGRRLAIGSDSRCRAVAERRGTPRRRRRCRGAVTGRVRPVGLAAGTRRGPEAVVLRVARRSDPARHRPPCEPPAQSLLRTPVPLRQ